MLKIILNNHGIKYKNKVIIPNDLSLERYVKIDDKLYNTIGLTNPEYFTDYFYKNNLLKNYEIKDEFLK